MVTFEQSRFLLGQTHQVRVAQLRIAAGQHCAIFGANGSGKSALAAVIADQAELLEGTAVLPARIGWVSTAQQQALIEAERRKGDADILDVEVDPSSARDIICRDHVDWSAAQEQQLQQLAGVFAVAAAARHGLSGAVDWRDPQVIVNQSYLTKPRTAGTGRAL